EPDVVHTHNPPALIYAAPAARAAGVPRVVHTKHGQNPETSARTLAARWLASRLCDRFVAVSEETARVARRRDRISDQRLRVVPNGIDVAAYARSDDSRSRVRRDLGISPAAVVIGTVGRLAPEKDQRLLIDAALPMLCDAVRLVVVGDGPLRA